MEKCTTCEHCAWIHEYHLYFCTLKGEPVFSWSGKDCSKYEKYVEED